MTRAEKIADARESISAAYNTWCRWHNPMSRRWLRAAIYNYRETRIEDAITLWEAQMLGLTL